MWMHSGIEKISSGVAADSVLQGVLSITFCFSVVLLLTHFTVWRTRNTHESQDGKPQGASRNLNGESWHCTKEVVEQNPTGLPTQCLFPSHPVCRIRDSEMPMWKDIAARLYEVDYHTDAPASAPTRELPELHTWLSMIKERGCNNISKKPRRSGDNCLDGDCHEAMDDIWATRALLAADFNVVHASQIVEKYVAWRHQFPGIAMPTQAWIDHAIVIVPFEDKQGRPIAISRLRAYHKGLPLSVMTNGYRATADGVIAHLLMNRDCSFSHGNPLEQWVLCIDCEGIGWGNFSMEYIKMFVNESAERYMERIAVIYMLGPPTAWHMMWGLLKPMLHPRTLRKIRLVPAPEVPSVMRDLMGTRAEHMLPPSYGGSARPIPQPGKGRTADEKVGPLLANVWRRLGVLGLDPEPDVDDATQENEGRVFCASYACCGMSKRT